MQFKFFTLLAALATLAVAAPNADAANGLDKRGCVSRVSLYNVLIPKYSRRFSYPSTRDAHLIGFRAVLMAPATQSSAAR